MDKDELGALIAEKIVLDRSEGEKIVLDRFIRFEGDKVAWINPNILGEAALPPGYLSGKNEKMFLSCDEQFGNVLHIWVQHWGRHDGWPVWLLLAVGQTVSKPYQGRIQMTCRRAEKRLSDIMVKEYREKKFSERWERIERYSGVA